MRITAFVLIVSAAVPLAVPAQTADSVLQRQRKTVFSIQPRGGDLDNPRLELERAVTRRLSIVLGSSLTLRNPAYAIRNTVISELDLGARFYPGGRAFHGAFLGANAGYDRDLKNDLYAQRVRVPRAFIGAVAGYDLAWKRLIIGPAMGLEYGRPGALGGRSFELHPRIGIGINFD